VAAQLCNFRRGTYLCATAHRRRRRQKSVEEVDRRVNDRFKVGQVMNE